MAKNTTESAADEGQSNLIRKGAGQTAWGRGAAEKEGEPEKTTTEPEKRD